MSINSSEVFEKLLFPLDDIISESSSSRKCSLISDSDWVRIGLLRVLSNEHSGRGFLEEFSFTNNLKISVGHFFNSLNSERRSKFLKELNQKLILTDSVWEACKDPIADYKELDDFDVFLGDGHAHKASVHEERIDEKKYATQHFYAQNLRTQMTTHMALAEYGDDRKKEHDMRMLKRQTVKMLRQDSAKGRKVLWIWDRAGVDFRQWRDWKQSAGIYFLSLEKTSNRLTVLGNPPFDKKDPVNSGVRNDEMVGSANGVSFRRVTYWCAEKKKTYRFLTNLPFSIRPGVVAYLYKRRWDIEKTYNTFKHKLSELKSWGKNQACKNTQANLICLLQNLAIILSRRIEKEDAQKDGVVNKKHHARKEKRRKNIMNKIKKEGGKVNTFFEKSLRLCELPKKFYRWLRKFSSIGTSWEVAYEALLASYARI